MLHAGVLQKRIFRFNTGPDRFPAPPGFSRRPPSGGPPGAERLPPAEERIRRDPEYSPLRRAGRLKTGPDGFPAPPIFCPPRPGFSRPAVPPSAGLRARKGSVRRKNVSGGTRNIVPSGGRDGSKQGQTVFRPAPVFPAPPPPLGEPPGAERLPPAEKRILWDPEYSPLRQAKRLKS